MFATAARCEGRHGRRSSILLEEFLKPGHPQAVAAPRLGISTVRVNEIVLGKRGVTVDTAPRLAELPKTTAHFWMHMQANLT